VKLLRWLNEIFRNISGIFLRYIWVFCVKSYADVFFCGTEIGAALVTSCMTVTIIGNDWNKVCFSTYMHNAFIGLAQRPALKVANTVRQALKRRGAAAFHCNLVVRFWSQQRFSLSAACFAYDLNTVNLRVAHGTSGASQQARVIGPRDLLASPLQRLI